MVYLTKIILFFIEFTSYCYICAETDDHAVICFCSLLILRILFKFVSHVILKILAMKTILTYESPLVQGVSIDVQAVLCSSLVFGKEGTAGYDSFKEDDIIDGGQL